MSLSANRIHFAGTCFSQSIESGTIKMLENFPTAELSPDECWPDETWRMVEDIEAAGWSLDRLNKVFLHAGAIATDALMIVQGGQVLASQGDVTHRYQCHSMRKSFLSALIGLYVESGEIDLSLTLAELDIDDQEGLSE